MAVKLFSSWMLKTILIYNYINQIHGRTSRDSTTVSHLTSAFDTSNFNDFTSSFILTSRSQDASISTDDYTSPDTSATGKNYIHVLTTSQVLKKN